MFPPTIRFFGSFLLSVVLWGSADYTSPSTHLPSPRTPPPPPSPAPTPGPAPLSSPAPTSPLAPLPGLLAATSPRCCAFRESIKREAQQFRFQSTRLMIQKAASPPTPQDALPHPRGWPQVYRDPCYHWTPKKEGLLHTLVPVAGWGVGVEYGILAGPRESDHP